MTTFATPPLSQTWTEIADGADVAAILIQLRDESPAHIFVGADAPAASTEHYFTLRRTAFPGAAFEPLAEEKVWARSATSVAATLEADRRAR
ncbi:hypothetical protein [Martelella radicis]|uniref:Uncharacterized protein n=1 Tax=Martelella radicis TaxID=1397476 RepID=A0A7W6PBQ8_9HYPH|nr:hypothetical protein [Martelella radicis]MBB4122904.1 hypothetical protein [Martelella radicis]